MIFVVEDDPTLRESVVEFMRHAQHEVDGFGDAEAALVRAGEAPPDLAICDLQLPGMGGIELMEKLGAIDPAIVRIAVTAHGSSRSAVRAIRAGCYEYLEKPVDLAQLERLVRRALGEQREQRELHWLRQGQRSSSALDALVGASPAMRAVREQVTAFAELGAGAPPILLLGETGVGKGLAARALHEARFGADAPFIEVNCAALPSSLIEAELFGYERSAFTDAKQAKPGLFEIASGGTIFLDEIGEFGLEVQAKLLTLIESRSVRRLGSLRPRAIDCAVVAASNVDLRTASQQGRFRPDLYHRLAGLTITLPPLRERAGDVLVLAEVFTRELAARYNKQTRELSAEASAAIQAYPWPGNVRELRGAIERATILSPKGAVALPAETLRALATGVGGVAGASAAAGPGPAAGVIDARGGGVRVELPADGISFDELEQAILRTALERTGGNVTRAAKLLGLNRDALRYRIRKFNLETVD